MPIRRVRQARDRAKARVLKAHARVDRFVKPKREAVERVWGGVRRYWPVQLTLVAWRRFKEDDSFAMAGYLAYTGLLSFFPFLIFLVMSGSYIVGRADSLWTVNRLFDLSPAEVKTALQPIFVGIIESKTGFAAIISAMVGLWAGSNAFEAARIGFNKAYDVREDRPFMKRRMQSLFLAAAAASVFVIQSFLIVLWPLLSNWLGEDGLPRIETENLNLLRYVLGMPLFAVLLFVLHRRLPRARPSWTRIIVDTEHGERWKISVWPGVIASTLLWFLGATAFSLYLRFAPSFAGNYGAMAGVVITLLFFYMSSVVIFFGAQVNIAREELRRQRTIDGRPTPEEAETYDERQSIVGAATAEPHQQVSPGPDALLSPDEDEPAPSQRHPRSPDQPPGARPGRS